MNWIARMMIVGAINSAGDTITIEEAQEIVTEYGGDPHWVLEPPPWVAEINRHYKEGLEKCAIESLLQQKS